MRIWRCAIIIGLCLLLSQLSIPTCVTQTTASDSPVFSDYGDFHADFVNESGSVWFHVTVTDPDGIAQVIGSTRNSSENLWHNVTLTVSESNADKYYGYYPVNLPNAGSVIYEVKYYAVDLPGYWNVSETTLHHLNNLGMIPSDAPLLLTIAVVLGIIGIASLVIVLKRKRA